MVVTHLTDPDELWQDIVSDIPAGSGLYGLGVKDPYTLFHSYATSRLAFGLCCRNSLSYDNTALTARAALLHDVGKGMIPDPILKKDGPLTAEQSKVMQGHARAGFDHLRSIGLEGEAMVAITVHEQSRKNPYPRSRYDGSRWSDYGQIVSVADMFSALWDDRAYKKPVRNTEMIGNMISDDLSCDSKLVEQVLEEHERLLSGSARFRPSSVLESPYRSCPQHQGRYRSR